MNSEIVREAALASFAGTAPFPEIVGRLVGTGVEYYHIDYIALRQTFYDASGSVVIVPITFEGLPAVAAELDVAALRAAILDSQRNGQKFRDFCHRAMQAGVQGYFAFLRGQRVTYLGRTGDQHIEWFPGAGPAKP